MKTFEETIREILPKPGDEYRQLYWEVILVNLGQAHHAGKIGLMLSCSQIEEIIDNVTDEILSERDIEAVAWAIHKAMRGNLEND